MSTTYDCIAKNLRNAEGNDLHRLGMCDSISTGKLTRTVKDDIDTTEWLYSFKDQSQLRITLANGRLIFIASRGRKL